MARRDETTPRCGRKTKAGTPCIQPAGFGTEHLGYGWCKFHGGTSPAGVKMAERLMVEGEMRKFGNPIEVAPHLALLQEVHRTAGHVAWLGQVIAQMEEDLELTQLVGGGAESYPRRVPSIWVELYQKERGHLARVSKMALDAGVAERQVRLAERQGELLAGAIQAILADLKLSPDQRKLAPGVVRRHLTALPAVEGG